MSTKSEAAALGRMLFQTQDRLKKLEDRRANQENVLDVGKRSVRQAYDNKRRVAFGRHGQPGNYHLPASPSERAKSETGKISFHFKQTTVAKSASYSQSGKSKYDTRGASHAKYIERDAATDINDVDLSNVPIVTANSKAASTEDYLERPAALEFGDEHSPAIFSNIGATKRERQEFWNLVTDSEANPRVETLLMKMDDHSSFWKEASTRDDVPKDLQLFLSSSEDIHLPLPPNKIQNIINWATTLGEYKPHDRPFDVLPGRGGRIQNRIVTELPHELTRAERSQIVRNFVKEFEERSLPYSAVIHAPDEHNDRRNYHLHIVYSDRPAKKIIEPTNPEIHNKWDFSIVETYTNKYRKTRKRRPYRQNKLREASNGKWIPILRQKWANMANDVLEKAGHTKRYDPRSYEEMGITKAPSIHLGTNAAALEAQGVATRHGVLNAISDHSHAQQAIDKRHEEKRIQIQKQSQKYLDRLQTIKEERPIVYGKLKDDLASLTQQQMRASLYEHYVDTVSAIYDRATGRAHKASQYADTVLTNIEKGDAEPVQQRRKEHITQDKENAEQYIKDVTRVMGDDLNHRSTKERELRALNFKITENKKDLEDRLGLENIAIIQTRHTQTRSRKQEKDLNDAFADISSNHHRVIENADGTFNVPAIAKKHKQTMAQSDATLVQRRLAGIKKIQDHEINRLVTYIKMYPHHIDYDPEHPDQIKIRSKKKAINTLASKWSTALEVVDTVSKVTHKKDTADDQVRASKAIQEAWDKTPTIDLPAGEKIKEPARSKQSTAGWHKPQTEEVKSYLKLVTDKADRHELKSAAIAIGLSKSASEDLQKTAPNHIGVVNTFIEEHQQERAALRDRDNEPGI